MTLEAVYGLVDVPRGIDPGPVLRGLRGARYYIWREGRVHNPPAGTQ